MKEIFPKYEIIMIKYEKIMKLLFCKCHILADTCINKRAYIQTGILKFDAI